MEVSKLVTKI